MQRPTIWKIAIVSAALGGLSVASAGTALAEPGNDVAPLTVTAPVPADWPYYDLDDLDDDWDDDAWGDD